MSELSARTIPFRPALGLTAIVGGVVVILALDSWVLVGITGIVGGALALLSDLY